MSRKALYLFLVVALIVSLFAPVQPAQAASPDIVISQIYGGGGNSGATYTNDFVELFNRGTSAIDVTGWSVQYASSTGSSWQKTDLAGTIEPGHYYLIQEGQGTGGTTTLPAPDATGAIAMSATNGKVALVKNSILVVSGTTCPTGESIADFIGYGSANCSEGSPAPVLTNTTANSRANGGCTDTDSNVADFSTGVPNPHNSSSPGNSCTVSTNPSGVGLAIPSQVVAGGSTLLTVAVTGGTNPPSTGLSVSADLTAIAGSAPQPLYDDGTNGDVTAGDNVFSYLATIPVSTTTCAKTLPVTISDEQMRSGSASTVVTIVISSVDIHDIQGASHISPLNNQCVGDISGIVTAKRSNGFYMQDTGPDDNPATSEGVFIFTSSAPTVTIGDAVAVAGTVKEYRAGGTSSANLTTTEIDNPGRVITTISNGNALPSPVVIGTGGRIPPAVSIESDATGDVETSGIFNPDTDGVDFYESLDGMLVQVNDAVAVGATVSFGGSTPNKEIAVLADNGAHAGIRTPRGGIVIGSTDFNPERIILNDLISGGPKLPAVNVGDSFPGAIIGVIDYSFGNFKLEVSQMPAVVSGGLARETTSLPSQYQLAVGTFNVENLAPTDPVTKFATLAGLIVNNLQSPDILAVEEIQDNSGAADDGVVDASTTWTMLITAIQDAGGPTYQYRQLNPVNNLDGGAPGANIRQGFLFRTGRGLSFVDHAGGDATTATAVMGSGSATELTLSPGRVDPTNSAFNSSRKPLAGEFTFNGSKVFVIANHFNSKSGDQPLFGRFQPPTFSSEVQRIQQATVVNSFANAILTADPSANVVVLGDLNDFQFSAPIATLKGSILYDLIDTLPAGERYSYVYDGNSETLDHILISTSVYNRTLTYDVVHVNSEFVDQASDHEPQVAFVYTGATPTVTPTPTLTTTPTRTLTPSPTATHTTVVFKMWLPIILSGSAP